MKKTAVNVAAIITFPQVTIGSHDVIVYPESLGGQMFAMIYNAGTTKAVWETLRFATSEEAIEDASKWIAER